MNWKDAKKIIAADPDVARALEENHTEYQVIRQIMLARKQQNLTQKQLAERANTAQANIARLEAGGHNPSIRFLEKVAKGLGKKLEIRLV